MAYAQTAHSKGAASAPPLQSAPQRQLRTRPVDGSKPLFIVRSAKDLEVLAVRTQGLGSGFQSWVSAVFGLDLQLHSLACLCPLFLPVFPLPSRRAPRQALLSSASPLCIHSTVDVRLFCVLIPIFLSVVAAVSHSVCVK